MRYNGYCGCLRAACTTGTRDYKVCERHGYYTMDNNQFNQYNNNSGGNGNNNGSSGGNGNGNGRDPKKQNRSILRVNRQYPYSICSLPLLTIQVRLRMMIH